MSRRITRGFMRGQCCNHCCIVEKDFFPCHPCRNRTGRSPCTRHVRQSSSLCKLWQPYCFHCSSAFVCSEFYTMLTVMAWTIKQKPHQSLLRVAITAELTGSCSFLAVDFLPQFAVLQVCQVLYRGCDSSYLKTYDLHR